MSTVNRPSDIQLFGVDIFLTQQGDLDTINVNGFSDLKTVPGRTNLRQAILNRLRTDPGDLPPHPSYGASLNTLASEGIVKAKELAFKYVVSALNNEPRIKTVTKVEFVTVANNAFDMNVEVQLQDSETPVNLVFPNFLK